MAAWLRACQAVVALHRINSKAFFDWTVEADAIDAAVHMLYLQQGGLTLPDPKYYTEDSKRAQLEALRQIIAKVGLRPACVGVGVRMFCALFGGGGPAFVRRDAALRLSACTAGGDVRRRAAVRGSTS